MRHACHARFVLPPANPIILLESDLFNMAAVSVRGLLQPLKTTLVKFTYPDQLTKIPSLSHYSLLENINV